jgi:hypothetical protein
VSNRPDRTVRRRRQRRAQFGRWAIGLAVALVIFGLGVALGQALHDNPRPGGMITYVKTLKSP